MGWNEWAPQFHAENPRMLIDACQALIQGPMASASVSLHDGPLVIGILEKAREGEERNNSP